MTVYLTACKDDKEIIKTVKKYLVDEAEHAILATTDSAIAGEIWDDSDLRLKIDDKVKDVVPPDGCVFILSEKAE